MEENRIDSWPSTGQGMWGQSEKKGDMGKARKLDYIVVTKRKMVSV